MNTGKSSTWTGLVTGAHALFLEASQLPLRRAPSYALSILWTLPSLFGRKARKEFARMIRPKLTATAIICHGRDTMVHLSVPGVHSDSSHSIELIARMLERLRERNVDGCGPELLIQGDNGPKEIKNNALVRYLSMLVCHGKLRRAEIHEDIGSLIANFAKLPSCWSRIVSTLPSITSTLCPLTLAVVMSDQTNLTSRWLWWTESVTGI